MSSSPSSPKTRFVQTPLFQTLVMVLLIPIIYWMIKMASDDIQDEIQENRAEIVKNRDELRENRQSINRTARIVYEFHEDDEKDPALTEEERKERKALRRDLWQVMQVTHVIPPVEGGPPGLSSAQIAFARAVSAMQGSFEIDMVATDRATGVERAVDGVIDVRGEIGRACRYDVSVRQIGAKVKGPCPPLRIRLPGIDDQALVQEEIEGLWNTKVVALEEQARDGTIDVKREAVPYQTWDVAGSATDRATQEEHAVTGLIEVTREVPCRYDLVVGPSGVRVDGVCSPDGVDLPGILNGQRAPDSTREPIVSASESSPVLAESAALGQSPDFSQAPGN